MKPTLWDCLHLTVTISGVKDKTVGLAPFYCACYIPNTKGDLGVRSGGQSNISEGENSTSIVYLSAASISMLAFVPSQVMKSWPLSFQLPQLQH